MGIPDIVLATERTLRVNVLGFRTQEVDYRGDRTFILANVVELRVVAEGFLEDVEVSEESVSIW